MIVPGLITLAAYVVFVIIMVAGFVWMVGPSNVTTYDTEFGTATTTTSDFGVGGLILIILAALALVFVVIYLQGAVTSGVLRVAAGDVVSVRSFLVPSRTLAFLATVVLMAIAIVVGLVLLIIPGLIAIFAFQFAPVFVLEQRMSPTAALTASAKLAFRKPLDSLLTLLIHYVYGYVGGLIAGLGAVVTVPMGEAFLVHAYRDLVDRPIPPGV